MDLNDHLRRRAVYSNSKFFQSTAGATTLRGTREEAVATGETSRSASLLLRVEHIKRTSCPGSQYELASTNALRTPAAPPEDLEIAFFAVVSDWTGNVGFVIHDDSRKL